MALEITAADVTSAEEFLASVLTEEVPEGRYTEGTALRDLCVKALSVAAAALRKENNTVQSLQSLLRIREIAANTAEADLDPAVSDAADAILSNWFITRDGGDFSRGVVQVYVQRKQDYLIPRTSRFFYDRTLAFYPDSTTDIVVSAKDVTPVVDARGSVIAYSFPLRLVAAKTGKAYNVYPGNWVGTGGFSPFVMRVTSAVRFEGGTERQSTADMIDQAPNAAAVRNLINARSITTTLKQLYKSIKRVTVIGMGDPEMQRDTVLELYVGSRVHVGGHFDIYLELPVSNTVFEGILGGTYTRPDGVINVFDDTAVADWTSIGVQLGDVIRITAGLPNVPRDFPIREIRATEMYTSSLHGFPSAASNLSYYIYRPLAGPDVQIYPTVSVATTGLTTNTVQTAATLILPAEPHYDILDVAVVNPTSGDTYINDPDGFVHFTARVNTAPTLPTNNTSPLPFQLVGRSPENGQSSRGFDEIVLPSQYNGKRVRVRYQTLAGFSAIDTYARDRFQRVLAANVQPKGMHPVYLSCTVPYRLAENATDLVNELSLRQNIVAYINTFDPTRVIDMSSIMTYAKNSDPNIGAVYPFEIKYELLAPNGNVISFITSDLVAMDPTKLDPTSTQATLDDLLSWTVSDRTTRYLTRLDRIQVEAR